jgi:hypothetical protein
MINPSLQLPTRLFPTEQHFTRYFLKPDTAVRPEDLLIPDYWVHTVAWLRPSVISRMRHRASALAIGPRNRCVALVDDPCNLSRKHLQRVLAESLARCSEEPVGD